jgi:hypothetical protein
MREFGDADPEDAWDDNDPLDVKLAVIGRVIDDLRTLRFSQRRANALRLLDTVRAELEGL